MKTLNFTEWDKQKHKLSFDEPTHTYYWKNKPVEGSVTQVIKSLSNYGDIDPAILKAAGVRGTMVHKWIEDHFDRVPLPQRKMLSSYQPYIDAFLKWCNDYGERYSILASELKLISPTMLIAGTIDCIMYDHKLDKIVVLDFKTTASHNDTTVSAQLAAYALMLGEQQIIKTSDPVMGMVLYISKYGEYTFKALDIEVGREKFLECYLGTDWKQKGD